MSATAIGLQDKVTKHGFVRYQVKGSGDKDTPFGVLYLPPKTASKAIEVKVVPK